MTIRERIRSWTSRWEDRDDVLDRPEELSDEYLVRLQRDIDGRLEDGLTFKTVRRASW